MRVILSILVALLGEYNTEDLNYSVLTHHYQCAQPNNPPNPYTQPWSFIQPPWPSTHPPNSSNQPAWSPKKPPTPHSSSLPSSSQPFCLPSYPSHLYLLSYFTRFWSILQPLSTTHYCGCTSPCCISVGLSQACYLVRFPVCGTDGVTYHNKCYLDIAARKFLETGNGKHVFRVMITLNESPCLSSSSLWFMYCMAVAGFFKGLLLSWSCCCCTEAGRVKSRVALPQKNAFNCMMIMTYLWINLIYSEQ